MPTVPINLLTANFPIDTLNAQLVLEAGALAGQPGWPKGSARLGELSALSIAGLLQVGIESGGELVDEIRCIHAWATKRGSGCTTSDCSAYSGWIDDLDVVVRGDIAGATTKLGVAEITGASACVDQVLDAVRAFHLGRASGVPGWFLGFQELGQGLSYVHLLKDEMKMMHLFILVLE